MQFKSDGSSISYADDGDGPPIVFLHALGRSGSDWSTIVAGLAPSFRCVTIDFPGHGASEWTGNYEFHDLARAVHALITELDLASFSMVAHSMGGMVAWILAPDLAGRLDALVIEDTPAPTDRHDYPSIPPEPPEPVTYDWEARRQVFSNLNTPNPTWRERVVGLDVPTLLLAGSADDGEMIETAELLSDARIVTIPVGHWIHQEAPQDYVETIRRFLQISNSTTR